MAVTPTPLTLRHGLKFREIKSEAKLVADWLTANEDGIVSHLEDAFVAASGEWTSDSLVWQQALNIYMKD